MTNLMTSRVTVLSPPAYQSPHSAGVRSGLPSSSQSICCISSCRSIYIAVTRTHANALSASQFVHKRTDWPAATHFASLRTWPSFHVRLVALFLRVRTILCRHSGRMSKSKLLCAQCRACTAIMRCMAARACCSTNSILSAAGVIFLRDAAVVAILLCGTGVEEEVLLLLLLARLLLFGAGLTGSGRHIMHMCFP
jgi:hypothetical protein